jgi:hypothetical protein
MNPRVSVVRHTPVTLYVDAAPMRCRCMTTVYGGIKRCRAHARDYRGWCARHAHYNGANHTPYWPLGSGLDATPTQQHAGRPAE